MRYPSLVAALVTLAVFAAPVVAQQKSSYEALRNAYATYMDLNDPLAFPVKVRALSQNPYTFWRGSKDLFFQWVQENCSFWLDDPATFIPQHGDLHFGNIGSYAIEGNEGALAFGMVDFDDSDEMPFQIDLIQGFVTMDLVIRKLGMTSQDRDRAIATLVNAYRKAVASGRTPTELLTGNATVQRLLTKNAERPYSHEVEKYVGPDGKFIKGPLKQDLMRPADELSDAIAQSLARAVKDCPPLAAVFRYTSADEFRAAIQDVALRTRLGSSGSQGLKKYFVLIDSPFTWSEGPAILYLKEEIPSAAQRSGAVPNDVRRPGRRIAEIMARMTQPPALVSGWCELGNASYWVTYKEPWSDELDADDIKSIDELLDAAEIWGTVAGATPGHYENRQRILAQLDPATVQRISELAEQYVRKNQEMFDAFKGDVVVQQMIRDAEKTMRELQ